MVSATDGSAFTGSVTVYVTGDAGTQAVGSVNSGACTHEGNGYHTYAPAQAETNYDLIAFTFIGTGAVPSTVQVFTGFPQTSDLAAALATANVIVVSAVDGGEINIYQAVSLSATISGLTIPAGWTKVYWTVKRATSEADTDAILQMVETNPAAGTDGLLRVNGATGTAGNGTLTVNQAAGTVVIDLLMTICDDLALATGLVWSLKALHPTSASTLLAIGTVNVLGQATMAVA